MGGACPALDVYKLVMLIMNGSVIFLSDANYILWDLSLGNLTGKCFVKQAYKENCSFVG